MLLKLLLVFLLVVGVVECKPKVVLDVDPGVDDARALLMLFSRVEDYDILGITVSQGNTFLSNATHNLLRTLRLCGQLQVPVFVGDIYTVDGLVKNTSVFFGENGFGNIEDDDYDYQDYLNRNETAPEALVRLAKENPNEITLISLATLTNIAKAFIDYEPFGSLLKRVIIMGGNYLGIGNETPKAEFNFLIDPRAANIVLEGMQTEIVIVTWELCLNHSLLWDWHDVLVNKNTTKSLFIKNISQFGRLIAQGNNETTFTFADEIAVAIFLDPTIILESQQIVATVETRYIYNYAEMLVDWRSNRTDKNIQLVTKIDIEKIKDIFEESLLES